MKKAIPMTERDYSMEPSDLVAEFQIAFETSEDADLWQTLVREELDEVWGAFAALLKEFQDVRYVMCGLINAAGKKAAMEFIMADEELFLRLQRITMIERALFPNDVVREAFWRVHESNMSKLGDDGKPLRREDGKVLKGPNYKPPVLDDLLP
jgi:predicted HAD superfamily Cof-like phosphohydrolase